jgi:hypothetical protein
MSTVTFDKLAYLETLKASGVPEDQARAHAYALDAALRDAVSTKADVEAVRLEVERSKNEILRWLIGTMGFQTVAIAGALVALLKMAGH